MSRLACYLRCSTALQSVDAQRAALAEYAQRAGHEAVFFEDAGISGANDRRPGLDRLLDAARRREIGAVAVTRLDRLGRSLHHLLVVLGELEALGIAVVAIEEGIDSRTPLGRMFFQIRGAFAEYERCLIRERVVTGIAHARRKGTRLGRPPALDRPGRDRARRLHRHGHSVRAISCLLGVSRGVVARAVAGVAAKRPAA